MIIAQISDTHIKTDSDTTAERFTRAVEHLNGLPTLPDITIITGDCVQNGTPQEYERFQSIASQLRMPYYTIPGNHDNRVNFLKVFGSQGSQALEGFAQYVIDLDPVRLIALDTNIPNSDAGDLCSTRLQWLEERLNEAPERPTIIFMHHPPFLTGMQAFDEIGLSHEPEFGAIIKRNPQVELITAGHIHLPMTRRYQGTLAMTCTTIQFSMLPDPQPPSHLMVRFEKYATALLHTWMPTIGLSTYPTSLEDESEVIVLHDGERWLA
jgi:Icc protein